MAKRKTTETLTAEKQVVAPTAEDYTVLARRYRPQQFADLVGQEPVAQALVNALQTNRVAHAYLFTGARGVGKTSAARILAKALNCEKGPTTTPCDVCDQCRAIISGDDTDVIEVDGASNRNLDDVRDIRSNVQYRPSRGRFKIYIIDEVHALTTHAFQALLKTLEEPPPHVKFIFATTEVQKIPVTILSRCQRFDFGGISLPRIVERLRQIVAAEKMQADDEALELVARRAGGSMRDAQSLLDQLLAFSGDKLTADVIHQLLGTAHEDRVASLASSVLAKEAKTALERLGEIVNQGQQLGELLDQLIDYWRDLMVVNSAGSEGQDLSVSGAQRKALSESAGHLKLDTILAGLDILVSAKMRMKNTGHGRVVLEMALVRLAQLDDLVAVSQLALWIKEGGGAQTRTAASQVPGVQAKSTSNSPELSSSEKKKLIDERPSEPMPAQIPLTNSTLQSVWQQLLREAGFALSSDLRKASALAISGPNTLVLAYAPRYNVGGVWLLDAPRVGRVEELLKQLTGEAWLLRLEAAKDDAGSPGSAPTANGSEASPNRAKKLREEIKKLPIVQKAQNVLGADIVSCDPEFGVPVSALQPIEDAEDE